MTIEEYTSLLNNPKSNEISWYTRVTKIEELGPETEMAFDSYFRYKKHIKEPVFFVKNGYKKDSEWVPFSLEDEPHLLVNTTLKYSYDDGFKMRELVKENKDLIIKHANHEIDSFGLVLGMHDRQYEKMYNDANNIK